MIDDHANADRAAGGDAGADELAGLLAELEASKLALDAALHFDDRASVKPAYDRLMRIPAAHAGLPARLDRPPPASADPQAVAAHADTVATVADILAVLGDMSAGVERYHALSATLARLQARLVVAVARPGR